MTQSKSAFVAIVGKPNAGKSSLVNKIVGEKVAIVSSKPQTTRTRITGVVTNGETQLVLVDTPGLHRAKTKLSEHMVKTIKDSVTDVDLALLVVEPWGEVTEAEEDLIDSFKSSRMPAILVINKIDLLKDKTEIMKKINQFKDRYDFDEIIPISTLTGEGVDTLVKLVSDRAVEGPHFFPEDAMTDQPERVVAAEIIREKLLNNLFDELPHGIAVTIESMKEKKNGVLEIHATILCERKSHKGMIIGKGGLMLKKIGSQARLELESFFDTKINLQCWVKIKDDWRNKEGIIKSLGLS